MLNLEKAQASTIHPLDALVDPRNEGRRVCVVGLGFVGLPLALSFSMRGCQVTGLDISSQRVSNLNRGVAHDAETYLGFPLEEILTLQLRSGRFQASLDPRMALRDCRDIIITVGIPIRDGVPVMDHLVSACRTVARHLKSGHLVVIRSTVTPGTTEGLLRPILESTGLKAGKDFHLAYASERIAEGRAFEEFEEMPLILAGVDPASTERARELLSIVTHAEIHTGSCIAAIEMAKVVENVQRDVNIAMVQEFARLCEATGLDTYEVIRLANTHRRVNLLQPGPGVGGFCIPNAFYYLLPLATEAGVVLRLLRAARAINDGVPHVVVDLIKARLKEVGQELKGSRIAILGLAMKDYSSDDRLSPSLKVVDLLIQGGAEVRAYDPLVPTEYPYKVPTLEECLTGAHSVVILARQKGAEFDDVCRHLERLAYPIIIDTKGAVDPRLAAERQLMLGRL